MDYPEFVVKLADLTVSCSLPENDQDLLQIASKVQRHKDTKSCRKSGRKCRYGFPKLPLKKTIIAKPLDESIDKEQRETLLKKSKEVLTKARELLETELEETFTFENFLEKLGVTEEEYEEYCSITERGKVILLKRTIQERYINNYNPEWLKAWNANMDIQIALDPFAIIAYIVSYVSKDESGMTEFLKEALNANFSAAQEVKLKALLRAYLTHRQVGLSEAVYRAIHDMKLKDSNITCVWVSTGFPENRYMSFRKLYDENPDEHEDDVIKEDENENDEPVTYNREKVKIQNKQGYFQQATSIHERYADRPSCLEKICLGQFASVYTYTSSVPKHVEFNPDGSSKDEKKSGKKFFGFEEDLPCYVMAGPRKFYRLRKVPAVVRTHASKRKEGHEQHFAELQLFHPWRNEVDDLLRYHSNLCIELYDAHKKEILQNRKLLYTGEEVVELMDLEMIVEMRPSHVYDTLNPEGEQEQEDDKAEGVEDDPNFAAYDHGGNLMDQEPKADNYKYKSIDVPSKEDLQFMTRRLVDEQQLVLQEVVGYCKKVKRSRKTNEGRPPPCRIIVHGGAGVGKSAIIRVVSMHAEEILREAGSHPHKPRVLILAPTGKAASLIGEFNLNSFILLFV